MIRPTTTPTADERPTSHGHARLVNAGGRPWLGWVIAALATTCLAGCTTVADPVTKPEDRLKQVLNPLGARSDEQKFKAKVEKDPFPSAAKTGLGTQRN